MLHVLTWTRDTGQHSNNHLEDFIISYQDPGGQPVWRKYSPQPTIQQELPISLFGPHPIAHSRTKEIVVNPVGSLYIIGKKSVQDYDVPHGWVPK